MVCAFGGWAAAESSAPPLQPGGKSADSADAPPAAARASVKPDASRAVGAIEKLHEVIIEVMKNADTLGYDGRLARLDPVLQQTFDLPFMAEKSAGRYWKDFTDEQQKRWVDAFSRMTKANYAGRFDGYSGQSFETLGSEEAGFDTLLVRTKLAQPEDEDVEINYRLRPAGGTWKVVDIYLNGTVSELALRRAEYGAVLQRDGFDRLVKDLETKIAELRAGTSG
jgi:phospholipid transport system substrate-binding protein